MFSLSPSSPTYIVIGHVTVDLTPDGPIPGGTALYGAVTALRQGLSVGVVTSVTVDYLPQVQSLLPGVHIANVPASASTTFENVYRDGHRTQFLRARAHPLTLDDVPMAWRAAPVVHLAPLDDEVPLTLAQAFPQSLTLATPQGWLRRWDADGRVSAIRGQAAADRMPSADLLVFSVEDVDGDASVISACRQRVPLLAVTSGCNGSMVYTRAPLPALLASQSVAPTYTVRAYPAQETDPTGAGDVYATSLALALYQTADIQQAGNFASAAASFVVEGPGITAIPMATQIAERLARYS